MLSTCRLQIARARTDEVVALQDQREGLFLQVLREDLAGFVKQVQWTKRALELGASQGLCERKP
jgi:hypothetical protein